jgi:hypothetical protein
MASWPTLISESEAIVGTMGAQFNWNKNLGAKQMASKSNPNIWIQIETHRSLESSKNALHQTVWVRLNKGGGGKKTFLCQMLELSVYQVISSTQEFSRIIG